jgi:hypothetical protein
MTLQQLVEATTTDAAHEVQGSPQTRVIIVGIG